jgi:hypothetical protein
MWANFSGYDPHVVRGTLGCGRAWSGGTAQCLAYGADNRDTLGFDMKKTQTALTLVLIE